VQSEKILAFSNFLSRPPRSYSEIAKYLVMNTFSEEKILAIYIGELTETGVVCVIGGFGWDAVEYASLVDIPIQSQYPITDSIRTNEVIVLNNDASFEAAYPLMAKQITSVEWESGIAIPVYPIGGMALYSSKRIELTQPMKVFFVAIGSLLGLYASRLPVSLVEVALNVKQKIDLPQVPLSDRQLVIAGLLERGFNNSEIALEIGYSESLIRQEAVAIYRKLDVTGRKAMQAIRTLNLKTAAQLDQTSELTRTSNGVVE
jgi:DNA-binding CsgD family transcriptional regulator